MPGPFSVFFGGRLPEKRRSVCAYFFGQHSVFYIGAEAYYRLNESPLVDDSAASEHLRSGRVNKLHSDLFQKDPLLVISPMKQAQSGAQRRIYGKEKTCIYDVIYTFNAQGQRVTPERPGADTAVLLFGCSLTFGTGVNDQETYAWKLGELLGEKYQVINLAVAGYGAHETLAMLEDGRLDDILGRYRHIFAFFLTIAGHANRSSGFAPWVTKGPRYELKNGKAVYAGDFSQVRLPNKMLDSFFKHSAFYDSLRPKFKRFRPQAHDQALHAGILATTNQWLRQRNVDFTVLIWPDYPTGQALLQAQGLQTLDLGPCLIGSKTMGHATSCRTMSIPTP